MPEDEGFDPEDFEGVQPKMATLPRAEVRRFEKDRKELQRVMAELAQREREAAFLKAGIPVDEPAAKYFVRAYDGDLNPEAIRAAAIEARVLSSTATTPEEVRAHEAAQMAAAGGTPTGVGPDYQARLAELSKKQFAPADDAARQQHIQEIIALAKEAGASFPVYRS